MNADERGEKRLPLWRGRPGLASRWHPLDKLGAGFASGSEQGQDALATSQIENRCKSRRAGYHLFNASRGSFVAG